MNESAKLIESDGKLSVSFQLEKYSAAFIKWFFFFFQESINKYSQLQDETESLRIVLDLKQKECAELRKKYEEAARDADILPGTLLKVQTLQARVEDLEIQLERKTEFEK